MLHQRAGRRCFLLALVLCAVIRSTRAAGAGTAAAAAGSDRDSLGGTLPRRALLSRALLQVAGCTKFYTVQAGQGCFQVGEAQTPVLTIEQIEALNPGLVCANGLQLNQRLCVAAAKAAPPPPTSPPAPPPAPPPRAQPPRPPPPSPATKACTKTYTAQQDQGCFQLGQAQTPPLTVQQIEELNPGLVCANGLLLGQQVCVARGGPPTNDSPPPPSPQPACGKTVKVQQDESCFSIATKYQMTLEYFMSLNNGLVCTNLQPFTTVCVAAAVPLPPSPPPAPPSPEGGGKSSLSGGAIAGIVIACIAGVALLAALAWFLVLSQQRRHDRGAASGAASCLGKGAAMVKSPCAGGGARPKHEDRSFMQPVLPSDAGYTNSTGVVTANIDLVQVAKVGSKTAYGGSGGGGGYGGAMGFHSDYNGSMLQSSTPLGAGMARQSGTGGNSGMDAMDMMVARNMAASFKWVTDPWIGSGPSPVSSSTLPSTSPSTTGEGSPSPAAASATSGGDTQGKAVPAALLPRSVGGAAAVVRVEAGVNDVQVDRMAAANGGVCPVVRLTAAEVASEIQLVSNGMLGKGGTAVVFKGLWPNRFGPDALLAVKVLCSTHASNPLVLKDFAKEAELLASIRHPNVVRLYGLCLEAPVVCLVLELLPGTLADRIHHRGAFATGGPGLLPHLPSHALTTTTTTTTTTTATTATSTSTSPPSPDRLPTHPASPSRPPSQQQPPRPQALSMLEVLSVARDVAAGLAFLHSQCLPALDGQPAPAPAPAQQPLPPPSPSQPQQQPGPLARAMQQASGALPDGLQAAPSAEALTVRIVHRDLKPANILLSTSGVAKISDFGLARAHMNSDTVNETRMGAGTIRYMAPELLLSRVNTFSPPATNRTDIYALAMILWEMLSGTLPWGQHATEASIVACVVTKAQRPELPLPSDQAPAPPAPTRDLSQVPASLTALPALNALINRCWQQRELRRPTAAEVYHEVLRLLEGCAGGTP